MKLKELAEKVNKSVDEVKRVLQDFNVTVKSVSSVIDDATVARVIEKYNPKPVKKVIKVIKKADLARVKDTVEEQAVPITAAQKAIRVMTQDTQRKKDEERITLEEKDKELEKTVVSRQKDATLAQDGIIRNQEISIPTNKKVEVPAVPVNPLKQNTHHNKNEKSFKQEKTFRNQEINELKVLQQKSSKGKGRSKRHRDHEEPEMVQNIEPDTLPTEIVMTEENITLIDFSKKTRRSIPEIMGALLKAGMLITINQNIDLAMASKIGELLSIKVSADFSEKETSKLKYDLNMLEESSIEDNPENLVVRPPIVTIMGHVDHGKTKLLDTIRSTRVMEGEAGGITQHIGAYQIEYKKKKITFLDTPGHEAFTSLRARGAQITDIVILVVAANDGIMPQTIEAIHHAKAAGVPIIVAINKVDLPEANVDKVKQQLTEHDLVPEEWGGKTVCCEVSAKQNIGIDGLLDIILLVAEMEDLKANPNKNAQGIIVEAQLSKQRGPVATVLIKAGTLRVGDIYIVGSVYGRIRAMFNDHGKEVAEAPPAYPVELIGLTEVPKSGEVLKVVATEKEARAISEIRAGEEKEKQLLNKRALTLQSISKGLGSGEKKSLNIIIKADVQGSLEALTSSLAKIKDDTVNVNIVHSGTGIVNKSDIMLAKASEAVILAFTVGIESEAELLAAKESVEIRKYNIIYKLLEDIELAISGMLEPEYEDIEIGKAEVRSIFKSSKTGNIAGAFVSEGIIKKSASLVKLYRRNKIIHEGKFSTLKRFKDDVKEVQNNFEFGFTLAKFEDYQEGDVIVVIETREKPRTKKNV